MLNLYDLNNIVFWTEDQIRVRRMMEAHFVASLTRELKEQNAAFDLFQVEAPLLTPATRISANYTARDYFSLSVRELALRPETTMGSYAYARHLLNTHQTRKVRLPSWSGSTAGVFDGNRINPQNS